METRQHVIDDDHLLLLSIAHYGAAALYFGFAAIFLLHAFMLGSAVADPTLLPGSAAGSGMPEGFAKVMLVIVCLSIASGWTFSALTFWAGRCIARRRRRPFVSAMAYLQLIAVPLGTVLGACTLIVLRRPSVRAEFEEELQYPPHGGTAK